MGPWPWGSPLKRKYAGPYSALGYFAPVGVNICKTVELCPLDSLDTVFTSNNGTTLKSGLEVIRGHWR